MASEEEIRDYWQAQTCGTSHATAEPFSQGYFDEIEAHRYRTEPFIRDFAGFERAAGRRVLEIGVGAATDFVNFARHGALLTGIDLTPAAVEHARRRLALERLRADLHVASAERLPFADGAFELVYSWGVLHHAADPRLAVAEVRRVLAPGGEARIMLYGRHSWFAYKLWPVGMLRALRAGRRPTGLSATIAETLESPGTRAYTRAEIGELFATAGFARIAVEGFLTPYDERFIGPLARRVRRDWFLGVTAS